MNMSVSKKPKMEEFDPVTTSSTSSSGLPQQHDVNSNSAASYDGSVNDCDSDADESQAAVDDHQDDKQYHLQQRYGASGSNGSGNVMQLPPMLVCGAKASAMEM